MTCLSQNGPSPCEMTCSGLTRTFGSFFASTLENRMIRQT